MQYWPLCVFGFILQLLFILTESRKEYRRAVVLKGSASVMFVILGVLCAQRAADADFAHLIVIGLLLGALGDILLNLRFLFEKNGQKVFLAGIAAFLAGHVLYLAALITLSAHVLACLLAGLALAALLLWWIFSALGEIKKAFKIFGVVYIGVICLMTAMAAGNYMISRAPSSLLFLIGAVLFLASDVIMIFNTFGAEQKQSLRTSNLILYYLGQLLIALSLQCM